MTTTRTSNDEQRRAFASWLRELDALPPEQRTAELWDWVRAVAAPAFTDPDDKRVNVALQGGGVLGIAEVGVMSALLEDGYIIENIAGTSAGSIVAAMVAARMDPATMRSIISQIDYKRFKEIDTTNFKPPVSWLAKVPVVGRVVTMVFNGGTYSGNYLTQLVDTHLNALGSMTWGEHRARVAAGQASDLKVIAYNHNQKRKVTYPDDYVGMLGMQWKDDWAKQDPAKRDPNPIFADDQPISFGVRSSSSIAAFFVPTQLHDPSKPEPWLFSDGGSAEDYPWLTAQSMDPSLPTIGIRLSPINQYEAIKPQSLTTGFRLFTGLLTSGATASLQALEAMHNVLDNTIQPDTLAIEPTNFDLTLQNADDLWRSGYQSGKAWGVRDMARRQVLRDAIARGILPKPGLQPTDTGLDVITGRAAARGEQKPVAFPGLSAA